MTKDYPKIPIGKDAEGNQCNIDIREMGHLKIIGESGSGKSNLLHSIITFLISEYSPDEVCLILSSQKGVEFNKYKNLPHLLFPLLKEIEQELFAIQWLIYEMDRRFSLLGKEGVKNIVSYNKKRDNNLPIIFYIINEASDLLESDRRRIINKRMIELAQISRVAGIHLIVSTSSLRNYNSLGLFFINLTTELIFKLANKKDYRKFFGPKYKERPNERGEALYLEHTYTKPVKLFIPFLSKSERNKIISKVFR